MPTVAQPLAALPTDIHELADMRECLTVEGQYVVARDGEFAAKFYWDSQDSSNPGWAVLLCERGAEVDSDAVDTVRDLDSAISWLTE